MSRHRSRIVALQAIVVGVLAVIVVVTLLKPEDSGPLFGVTTPGPESALPSPGAYVPRTGEHGGPNGPGNARVNGRRNGPGSGPGNGPGNGPAGPPGQAATGVAGVIGGTATVPAPVVGAAPNTPAGAVPGAESRNDDGEGSPADDQYARHADPHHRAPQLIALHGDWQYAGVIRVTLRTC